MMDIYDYIKEMPNEENEVESFVTFGENQEKRASFWHNGDDGDFFTLTVRGSEKFWRDEYICDECDNEICAENLCTKVSSEMDGYNDIQLTAEQLYNELKALPNVDLINFYGLRCILSKHENEQ